MVDNGALTAVLITNRTTRDSLDNIDDIIFSGTYIFEKLSFDNLWFSASKEIVKLYQRRRQPLTEKRDDDDDAFKDELDMHAKKITSILSVLA